MRRPLAKVRRLRIQRPTPRYLQNRVAVGNQAKGEGWGVLARIRQGWQLWERAVGQFLQASGNTGMFSCSVRKAEAREKASTALFSSSCPRSMFLTERSRQRARSLSELAFYAVPNTITNKPLRGGNCFFGLHIHTMVLC